MAFRIALSPTYEQEVRLAYPGEDGRIVKAAYVARFKRLSHSDMSALRERLRAGDIDDAGFIREVLAGWRGMQDESGGELEFGEAALAAALDLTVWRGATIDAFWKSFAGAREKN